MTEQPGPTPPSERIVSLDALRGFALLGILLINVRVFSMPETVLLNPTVYGDFTGANYAVWLTTHLVAELKFITLFSMLFGAGTMLFTATKRQKNQPVLRLHYRRTLALIVIGLGHAYLLWYGDILVAYGLCGLWLILARNWTPRTQALFGLFMVFVPSMLEVSTGLTTGTEAITAQWSPPMATLTEEVTTYQSGWLEQMDHRVPTALQRQTEGFLGVTLYRAGGSMLLGMALFQWGVLTEERSDRFYRRLALYGTVVGVPTILAGVWFIELNDWGPGAALFYRQFNYWGSLALSTAYIGLVIGYCRHHEDGILTRALAAVGRTAFTNYLLQTVLATTIFYGHGLGLFGQVSRVEGLGIVVVIWAIQIPLSVLWLRYFRFGPVEWVWRVLTYGRGQPLLDTG